MRQVHKASKYIPPVKAEAVFSPNKSHCTKGIQYNKVLELVYMLKACRQPSSRHWEDITEDKHDKMQASNLLYMMSTSKNHDPLVDRGLYLYPKLVKKVLIKYLHQHCKNLTSIAALKQSLNDVETKGLANCWQVYKLHKHLWKLQAYFLTENLSRHRVQPH